MSNADEIARDAYDKLFPKYEVVKAQRDELIRWGKAALELIEGTGLGHSATALHLRAAIAKATKGDA
jgi:hypothetical protein